MSTDSMDRGRQQVLYNYLPNNTFDHDGGKAICIVTGIDGIEVTGINKNKIVKEIGKYIYGSSSNPRWFNDNIIGFPEKSDFFTGNDIFTFIRPDTVRYDVYPLVFQCQKCGRVYEYDSMNELFNKNQELNCINNCQEKGNLRQIYHVFVHECGEIASLEVPYCPKHKRRHMIFDDRRSQQVRDFRWICAECGWERSVIRRCIKCKSEDHNFMHLNPHRANITYYPHYFRMVDVGHNEDLVGLDNTDEINSLISKYLNTNITGNVLSEEDKRDIEFYKEKLLTPLPDSIKDHYETEMNKLKSKINKYEEKINLKEISESRIFELSEYVYILEELKCENIQNRVDKLNNEKPGNGSILEASKDMVNKCGFDDVMIIEEFPVVTSVFGYTRVSSEPEVNYSEESTYTTIRPFPKRRSGKFPIYIDKGGTEALLFKLNPIDVINWLKANNIYIDADITTEKDAKLWFLEHINPIDRYAEIDWEEDIITYFVFNLIHSLSHCFIRASSLLSGFERMGIAEFLFPGELSFVIYSNKTVFTIGGFHTLYERSLSNLFQKATTDPDLKLCVYDPVCIDRGGACHGCMHLPEISCSFFNRQLGRVFLYGGKKDNREVKGFWNVIGDLDES